jgi:hypothetical protein
MSDSKAGSTARSFVSISIDADVVSSEMDKTAPSAEAVRSVVAEIMTRIDQAHMPATWAYCDPAKPAAQKIAESTSGHELALLAKAALANAEYSRSDVMQAIVRPLQSAMEQGLSISTLTVPFAWQPKHIDLLTKYGLKVIRTPHVFSSQTTTGVRAVCHGLWQVPVAAVVQNSHWMANLGQWRNVRRAIDQAVLQGGWCHLCIEATSIARGDSNAGLRCVGRMLQHLHTLRNASQIAVETLREAAVRLAPKRTVPAANSILRAA